MKIQSSSQGASIINGGTRLPPAEERALNILLRHAGGEEQGAQLYKLGWAMEDNQTTFDPSTGLYKYDSKKIPLCIEANQASYHLLSWAPPTMTDLMLEHEFEGEDFSKGAYTCIMHFLQPDGTPLNPTAALIERIIPVLKDMHEIATATRKGFNAERDGLRAKRIARFKQEEANAAKAYESTAEAILGESAAAFEGNPTSFQGKKGKTFADLKPGERPVVESSEEQPIDFAFSARGNKSRVKNKE